MKKILVAATILLGGLIAVNAQTPRNCERQANCRPATECATPCATPDSGQCCQGLFAGIELTPQQQEALQQLRAQCRNNRDRNCQARACQAQENRRQRLAAIKNILTPEQYIQFLENSFVQGPRQPRHGDMHQGRQHRAMDGTRAERCARQGQAPARQLQQQQSAQQ